MRTELTDKGADINRLTDLQRRFCLEYLQDYNGARAARRAGYKGKNCDVIAAKLMRNPIVKAFIGRFEQQSQQDFEISRYEILKHLAACATRNAKQFVDRQGRLLLDGQNINDLPDEVTCAVDTIRQKRRSWMTRDGEEVVEVETEIRLVPKAQAIEMCMKHKGLFAPQQVDVRGGMVTVDWDKLRSEAEAPDPIEQRLLEAEE